MKEYFVVYYQSRSGECEIEEFINNLTEREQAKVFAFIGQLQRCGPQLPRPYANTLRDGIHELRIKL